MIGAWLPESRNDIDFRTVCLTYYTHYFGGCKPYLNSRINKATDKQQLCRSSACVFGMPIKSYANVIHYTLYIIIDR